MKKMLIVDDSFTVRKVLEMLLMPLGYNITFAENASKAVELTGSNDFDGAVLDFGLPDKDGAALSKELKKIKPSLPILIMFNSKELTADKILSQAQCEDVIEKPFDSHTFLAKLEGLKSAKVPEPTRAAAAEKLEDLFDFDFGEEFKIEETKPEMVTKKEAPVEKGEDVVELEELVDLEELMEPEEEEIEVEELKMEEEVEWPKKESMSDTVTLEDLLSEEIVIEEKPEKKEKIELEEIIEEEPFLEKVEEQKETKKTDEASIDINEFFSDLNEILKEKEETKEERIIFEEKKVKPVVEEVAKELKEMESLTVSEDELDIWDFEVEEEKEEKSEPSKPAVSAHEPPIGETLSFNKKEIEQMVREITYEVVEKIAWEVVPEIVDTIIKDKFSKK